MSDYNYTPADDVTLTEIQPFLTPSFTITTSEPLPVSVSGFSRVKQNTQTDIATLPTNQSISIAQVTKLQTTLTDIVDDIATLDTALDAKADANNITSWMVKADG